jgi:bifunctional UDP-N-acetylglucosamine pyrophosphorylase/glucosamine-1-phosphate N-acetyltransferase
MRSGVPKVLHPLGGRSLLGHALAAAQGLSPQRLAVVVRHERDQVARHVRQIAPEAVIADQDELKGTGRAVECGLDALPEGLAGTVVVTYGDVPLLTTQTLAQLVAEHEVAGAAVSLITARVADPTGYGRVVRDPDGAVQGVVEHRDASPGQRQITEINSGIYAFDGALLRRALAQVGVSNAQGEKYLTDVVGVARRSGLPVRAHLIADVWQVEGVNDRVQLAALGAEFNRRVVAHWMRSGVHVVDPGSTWVDAQVLIGPDTILRPGVQLLGVTRVGSGAVVGPECTLTDTQVGDGARLTRVQAEQAVVGDGAQVGPYAVLDAGSTVAPGQRVGAFAQVVGNPA